MTLLSPFEMWYGRDEPPPEIVKMKAGQLELEYQEGDLRYICCGGRELIRRIYVAIRDVNWNTIPGKISNLIINSNIDHFDIHFNEIHQVRHLKFQWNGTIIGSSDGRIEYKMEGVAGLDFRYCRIGFCILHPVEGVSGRPYRAVTPNGIVSGILPELIEPQRLSNGFEVPIFPACSNMTIDLADGFKITTDFEGDLFEMEDQRNWTDGSFKTYCTPINIGYPHSAKFGQVFNQKVSLNAEFPESIIQTEKKENDNAVHLSIEGDGGKKIPKIGFGITKQSCDFQSREIELISRLHPNHLKIELHFQESSWIEKLDTAISLVKKVGSRLELVIFLSSNSDEELAILATRLPGVPVYKIIVFQEDQANKGTTSSQWIKHVRKNLSGVNPGIKLIGGTNGNFAELNRERPDISVMDGVVYTVNPQVHLIDERSVIEALEAQRDTVITARSFCGNLPISISSVTLKPPFNQAATENESTQDVNELPTSVDQRQMSLFAAAWTVGSIRSLTMGGADSVTFYEMNGWRGLMETKHGSLLPLKFRSFPGMVFPLYYIFEFIAKAKGKDLFFLCGDKPRIVEGFGLKNVNYFGFVLSNLQSIKQEVKINNLPEGRARVRRLNEKSMPIAISDPDSFLKLSEIVLVETKTFTYVLEPYETSFIEISGFADNVF